MLTQPTLPLLSDRPDVVDQLTAYDQEHSPLCDCPYLCMEEDYQAIAQHLQARSIPPTTLTDIGCAFGVQSLYFPEWEYIGVDRHQPDGCAGALGTDPIVSIPFFREGEPGVQYVLATFPDLGPQYCGDVFISNMAVGYPLYRDTTTDLAAAFGRFQCGYFKGPADILERLQRVFPQCERVKDGRFMAAAAPTQCHRTIRQVEHDFSVYFLAK